MPDYIISVYSYELTQAEIDAVIEALSAYYELLEIDGETRKAQALISAAAKLGFYSED